MILGGSAGWDEGASPLFENVARWPGGVKVRINCSWASELTHERFTDLDTAWPPRREKKGAMLSKRKLGFLFRLARPLVLVVCLELPSA